MKAMYIGHKNFHKFFYQSYSSITIIIATNLQKLHISHKMFQLVILV